ncbi:hypothetical protein RRG08_006948 [Elysia crispata]|uniref:Uncharacterized protein n=1 Tax=Elysia crispata TaxID=231223 RepID=A0AAE0XR33_9GAST|nr:hypothetical protein RRG08_006948 [Elysia crispata]
MTHKTTLRMSKLRLFENWNRGCRKIYDQDELLVGVDSGSIRFRETKDGGVSHSSPAAITDPCHRLGVSGPPLLQLQHHNGGLLLLPSGYGSNDGSNFRTF